MGDQPGLTVRQHERWPIDAAIEFVVCTEHREQVRFSPIGTAPEPHVTQGRAVDISAGGMHLICRQFLPRMCQGSVRVLADAPDGDGRASERVIFEHRARVRRIGLQGDEPVYALGVEFVDPEPDLDGRVRRLLSRCGGPG